jgi:hypothetical protein
VQIGLIACMCTMVPAAAPIVMTAAHC